MNNHEYYMRLALKEAEKALHSAEIPVGAVVVIENKVISKGYNQVELLKDSTAHAEMIALTAGFNNTKSKYIPDATIYCTLEPCIMCGGAILNSKITNIVYGASDSQKGVFSNKINSFKNFNVISGILGIECKDILMHFFNQKRKAVN